MPKLSLYSGTTSKIIAFFVNDSSSTTGAGLTGLTNASGSLVAEYWREGAGSGTSISLSNGTLGTWSSGGFKARTGAAWAGWYELGVPNAALASGANSVAITLNGATNMAPVNIEIQLGTANNSGFSG